MAMDTAPAPTVSAETVLVGGGPAVVTMSAPAPLVPISISVTAVQANSIYSVSAPTVDVETIIVGSGRASAPIISAETVLDGGGPGTGDMFATAAAMTLT